MICVMAVPYLTDLQPHLSLPSVVLVDPQSGKKGLLSMLIAAGPNPIPPGSLFHTGSYDQKQLEHKAQHVCS